jgi:hypothetical protein
MWGYDITLNGSLLDSRETLSSAETIAQHMSEFTYPGRLIRIHDVDGVSVLAEYRDGKQLASV